jgi:hypothetical protein
LLKSGGLSLEIGLGLVKAVRELKKAGLLGGEILLKPLHHFFEVRLFLLNGG